jgi:hypothetical protein
MTFLRRNGAKSTKRHDNAPSKDIALTLKAGGSLQDELPTQQAHHTHASSGWGLLVLSFSALGVIYGDIGERCSCGVVLG